MIVLEGPDGGGKTTLATLICAKFQYTHIRSEGPEKYPGEINHRLENYFAQYRGRKDILFDRHPCVSQVAYRIVHNQTMPDETLINHFYEQKPLMIYCRPDLSRVSHTASGEWDTPEFIASVDEKYVQLLEWYDNWAMLYANHIYRIGDHTWPLSNLIKGWRDV